MKILFFGDVVGRTGREAVKKILPELKTKYHPDLIVANAENVAHGKGVTLHTLNALAQAGVDFFTSGNHVFDKQAEAKEVFEKFPDEIIRPANFPAELPGEGSKILEVKGLPVLLINLNGQVFMEKQFDLGEISNPFERINQILSATDLPKIKILDFHAEATSEKRAMGFWCDGRVSAVVGSHTHVATADAQILPAGTGYITDLGMVGAADSIIGVSQAPALKRLIKSPEDPESIPLEVAESSKHEVSYAVLEIDEESGKCLNITNETNRT